MEEQHAALQELILEGSSGSDEQKMQQGDDYDDAMNGLWNVTLTEDGQRVESIDPNDPKVRRMLAKEQEKLEQAAASDESSPSSGPQPQLLLLLTLLRERIKAEAAFGPDEKGRNLRLLAYCLQVETEQEQEQLVSKEVGNSLEVSDC